MAHHDNEAGAAKDRRDLMGGPDRPEYETEFGGPEPEGQRDIFGGADPDRREDEISPGDS